MKFKFAFNIARLAFIILVPLVLMILPADFFDGGESICLSRVLFNVQCYACGMTRACMHLIHFEFEKAYSYHMLSFVVVPLLAVIWIQWFLKEWKLFKRYRQELQSTSQASS